MVFRYAASAISASFVRIKENRSSVWMKASTMAGAGFVR
jgi:hypothetical protein